MSQQGAKAPKPAGARLDPAVRRAQLVEAAATLFDGRDPAEVSFEEVAEAAGVSRSLVYAYFGDRGGLIAAVYLHDIGHLDRELNRALDHRLPDEVRLRRMVRRYLQFARDHRTAWSLITSAATLHHPAVQAARRKRIERIAESWGSTPEAKLLARGMIGFLESAADDWAAYRECGLERATELLFGVLWRGIGGMVDEPGLERSTV